MFIVTSAKWAKRRHKSSAADSRGCIPRCDQPALSVPGDLRMPVNGYERDRWGCHVEHLSGWRQKAAVWIYILRGTPGARASAAAARRLED